MPIVLAIKKYGSEHFQATILERLVDPTQPTLDEREVYWGMQLNALSPNGYNLKLGQANGRLSEETKKKIGASNKGKIVSPETIAKLQEGHKGYKMKDSTKQKLSLLNQGKTLTLNHKKKIGVANTGKVASEAARKKMSDKKVKFNYQITSPDGVVFNTTSLHRFCDEQNLNLWHMHGVATGRKSHHKEWTVVRSQIGANNVSQEGKEETQDQPQ